MASSIATDISNVNNTTLIMSYEIDWNNDAINLINLIVLPMLILTGTIGNGLSFAIMMRKTMRNTGFCFYLATLAISDTVQLYTFGMWYIVIGITHSVLDISVYANCKLDYFLNAYSHQYSAWVMVAVTVERFISVYFPFKTKTLCTVRNAKLICGGLAVILFMLCCPNLLPQSREVTRWGPYSWCEPKIGGNLFVFITKVWPMLNIVIYGLLPSAVMIVMNVMIVTKIRKNTKTGLHDSGHSKKSHQLTISLLVVSTTYVVLTLPHGFYVIYIENDYENNVYLYSNSKMFAVLNLCMVFNHAINFVLYCLSGDRFRRELVKMFCSNIKLNIEEVSIMPASKSSNAITPVN